METNNVYCGDCLEVMADWPDESVDLVYLDPPYNTGKDWGAFDDRWESIDDYIEYLRVRLVELRRVMKDTASVYLHCDPTMSHYLKLLMDSIWGRGNFRNEVVWCYKSGGRRREVDGRKSTTLYSFLRIHLTMFSIQIPYEFRMKARADM